MTRRRFPDLLTTASLLLLVLAGQAWAQKQGGTLVMLVQPEPPTLASYINPSVPVGQVAAKVYDGLLEYDFNLKPIQGLEARTSFTSELGSGETVPAACRNGE